MSADQGREPTSAGRAARAVRGLPSWHAVKNLARSRAAWLCVLSLWGSSALAKPAVPSKPDSASIGASAPQPSVFSWVPPEIPAGGVIPVIGACPDADCAALRGVTVLTPTSQVAIAGHVEVVQAGFSDAWAYFVPDKPFTAGTTLLVAGNYPNGQSFSTQVVAATKLEASSVNVASELTKQRQVLLTRCCPIVRETGRERCLETLVETSVGFGAHLNGTDAAASQYLFELSVREMGAISPVTQTDFRPSADHGISVMEGLDGAASSYCYAVRAKLLSGGPVIDLLDKCIENKLEGLGRTERTQDEIERWLNTCAPPLADAGPPDSDDDDPSPARDASSARDADRDGRSAASEGCQLSGGAAPLSASLAWTLAALVPWLRSRTAPRGRARR